MKSYPYIGKSEQGNDYLVASSKAIYSYISRSWMFEPEGFAPAFKNITRDYLQPSHGEVVSLEHAEFIIEICKSNGIEPANNYSAMCKEFSIYSDKLFFKHRIPQTRAKKITIPLPPKADKQEVSEWPQVGDEVCWDKNDYTGTVKAISDGNAWCKLNNGLYHTIQIKRIKKPKTPEEELRDELINDISSCLVEIPRIIDSSGEAMHASHLAACNLMEKYNITKKV